jgi:hypothetical protein
LYEVHLYWVNFNQSRSLSSVQILLNQESSQGQYLIEAADDDDNALDKRDGLNSGGFVQTKIC